MNKSDWVATVLAIAGSSGLTPAQLQKSLFLIGKGVESAGADFFEFVPYHYGPYCEGVYREADKLAENGVASITTPAGARRRQYTIGAAHNGPPAAFLALPAADQHYVRDIVDWVRSVSFFEMCNSIYARYPEMAVNSVFRNQRT